MTIKELIEELSKYGGDTEVVTTNFHKPGYIDIKQVIMLIQNGDKRQSWHGKVLITDKETI